MSYWNDINNNECNHSHSCYDGKCVSEKELVNAKDDIIATTKEYAEGLQEEYKTIVDGELENFETDLTAYGTRITNNENDIADLKVFVTPEMYGAVGDGVTDDTEAWQICASKNKSIILNSNKTYKLSSQIDLGNCIIIGNNSEIKLNGDIDYLFYSNADNIYIRNLNFIKGDTSYTKHNRAIRLEETNTAFICDCNFYNFGTAIQCNESYYLYARNINIYNAFGIDSQYGYGINTSAIFNKIENIITINDSIGNGRHSIYLNGDKMKSAIIDGLYVENYHYNPVEIHTYNNEYNTNITIKNIKFNNVNPLAMDTNHHNGCINIASDQIGIVTIENVIVENLKSNIISSLARLATVIARNITVYSVDGEGTDQETIYIRYGENHIIENIKHVTMGNNNVSTIYVRQAENVTVNNVINLAEENSKYLVVFNASTAIMGSYYTKSTNNVRNVSSSTIKPFNYYS